MVRRLLTSLLLRYVSQKPLLSCAFLLLVEKPVTVLWATCHGALGQDPHKEMMILWLPFISENDNLVDDCSGSSLSPAYPFDLYILETMSGHIRLLTPTWVLLNLWLTVGAQSWKPNLSAPDRARVLRTKYIFGKNLIAL